MPIHHIHSQKVASINHIMRELNSLTDDIYESLMDDDYPSAAEAMTILIAQVSGILEALKDGQENG